MARPLRNDIDYFPHPVSHGKKMSYLEKKYGNDGYATWFKLLEELGATEYHYLNLSDEVQIMFLSDRCMIEENVLINIINDLVKLREFDKDLWENDRILFNEKFIDSIKDAYKKRNNKCVDKKTLLILLDGLGIRKLSKSNPKPDKTPPEGVENPQSKVEYSKVEKSKGKKTKVKDKSLLSKIDISDVEDDLKKYFEIARAFQELFIKNLSEKKAPTNHQEKATFKNYVDPIRLMFQNDGVTLEQLQCVFKYLQSPQGEFWKANILSTKKLREKFSQLVIKSKENGIKVNNNNRTDEELMQAASDAVNRMFGQ